MRIFHKIMLALLPILLSVPAYAEVYVTIIQGLGGQPSFDERFHGESEKILEASKSLTAEANISLLRGETAERDYILRHFSELGSRMSEDDRALVYLIGHGSFDGEQYKFNIPGPDIDHDDIKAILGGLPGQNHFLLNTSSSSGALLQELSDEGHIIITATRSGNERNAPEFGVFFAEALSNDEADLNKNNTISAEEAFNYAERQVVEFFSRGGQLATEHPQIRGENAGNFILARISSSIPEDDDNPVIARLRAQQLEIDQQIESLQLRRNDFSAQEYIEQLQALVLESARINQQIDQLREETDAGLQ